MSIHAVRRTISLCCLLALLSLAPALLAADVTIQADPRAFKPLNAYIAPGDVVHFTKMISHNTVSVEGLIPEGAEHWTSNLGENYTLRLEVPGIYSYVCQPHIGFGMVGNIVVGDITQEDIDAHKEKAMALLKGPYRRLIGAINKLGPRKAH